MDFFSRLLRFLGSTLRQWTLLLSPEGRILFRLKVLARLPMLKDGSTVPGNLTHLEGLCLRRMAGEVRAPDTIVEIGSYLGKSTNYLLEGIKDKAVQVACVDTWQNDAMSVQQKDVYDEFLSHVQKFKASVIPLRGRSDEIVKRYKSPIGLLFIDGDHSYEGCKRDIVAWLPLVNDSAILCFHDYGNPCGVRQAVDECVKPWCTSFFIVDSLFVGQYKRNLSS